MPFLFSYGTLQLESVQLDTFGRKLNGHEDVLEGFRLEQVEIKDEAVLASSAQRFHPIAVRSNDPADQINGMLFEITEEELHRADAYEVTDYRRIAATFRSGTEGWVYVGKAVGP